MNNTPYKTTITRALRRFVGDDLANNARSLLETLGYRSDRTIAFEPNTADGFIETFDPFGEMSADKALLQEWESIDFLFQLTEGEIVENTQLQIVFENYPVNNRIIESYLFFAIRLRGSKYNRADLSQITREINKLTPIPAMVIFQYGSFLALAIIDRRPSRRGPPHDVLEKITLIENIDFTFPDIAHVGILSKLSLDELYRHYQFRSFLKFHQAWQATLDGFDLSTLKPRRSAKRRYDHDKYPSEEVAKVSDNPYKAICEIFDLPYEMLFDDIEYEMQVEQYDFDDVEYEIKTRHHDTVISIIKGQYKII